jgi:hypothetical protein
MPLKECSEDWTMARALRCQLFFLFRILVLGIGLLHILSANIYRMVRQSDYCWELAPHMYFLTPGQQPQPPLTNLLIVNKTGKHVAKHVVYEYCHCSEHCLGKTHMTERRMCLHPV